MDYSIFFNYFNVDSIIEEKYASTYKGAFLGLCCKRIWSYVKNFMSIQSAITNTKKNTNEVD